MFNKGLNIFLDIVVLLTDTHTYCLSKWQFHSSHITRYSIKLSLLIDMDREEYVSAKISHYLVVSDISVSMNTEHNAMSVQPNS